LKTVYEESHFYKPDGTPRKTVRLRGFNEYARLLKGTDAIWYTSVGGKQYYRIYTCFKVRSGYCSTIDGVIRSKQFHYLKRMDALEAVKGLPYFQKRANSSSTCNILQLVALCRLGKKLKGCCRSELTSG
jgi:hypothetical protein